MKMKGQMEAAVKEFLGLMEAFDHLPDSWEVEDHLDFGLKSDSFMKFSRTNKKPFRLSKDWDLFFVFSEGNYMNPIILLRKSDLAPKYRWSSLGQ